MAANTRGKLTVWVVSKAEKHISNTRFFIGFLGNIQEFKIQENNWANSPELLRPEEIS